MTDQDQLGRRKEETLKQKLVRSDAHEAHVMEKENKLIEVRRLINCGLEKCG
jgi:hypothetical protein